MFPARRTSLRLAAALLLVSAASVSVRSGEPPSGMVLISEGTLTRGRDRSGRPDEYPRHSVRVSAFYMDETLVSHGAFRAWADETGYVTTAERQGWGMVSEEGMGEWRWRRTDGASWRTPFGPDAKAPPPRADDPVTSVSWDDANDYCRAHGKRLPTEAEWERAARAGRSETRFPWGDSPQRADGRLGLNFWQGHDHRRDTREDDYVYVSPVKAFPPNDWGVYDPVGNVWQWTADWYDRSYYRRCKKAGEPLDPQGPVAGDRKVARGGSWWCSANACSGYGLHYRGHSKPASVFNNNGFRCARDLSPR